MYSPSNRLQLHPHLTLHFKLQLEKKQFTQHNYNLIRNQVKQINNYFLTNYLVYKNLFFKYYFVYKNSLDYKKFVSLQKLFSLLY